MDHAEISKALSKLTELCHISPIAKNEVLARRFCKLIEGVGQELRRMDVDAPPCREHLELLQARIELVRRGMHLMLMQPVIEDVVEHLEAGAGRDD